MSDTGSRQPALVVVDMQIDVLSTCINTDQTTATIAGLVDRARAAQVPVVWVRHNADQELVEGTPGWQITPALRPEDGEPIVDKRFSDAFADTELADRLAELGAAEIVLCGAQTDACVRNTFYGGLYRGYPVTLVTDAHTTEDMREWGAGYPPTASIAVLNMQAAFTVLPGVRGSVTTAAEAFVAAT